MHNDRHLLLHSFAARNILNPVVVVIDIADLDYPIIIHPFERGAKKRNVLHDEMRVGDEDAVANIVWMLNKEKNA
jgi:hypothetical protein